MILLGNEQTGVFRALRCDAQAGEAPDQTLAGRRHNEQVHTFVLPAS